VRSRSTFTPYYFLVAGVLLQGLSPVFTKLLLADLSQATVVAARYLLAAGFLFPFGYRHEPRRGAVGKPTRRDWVALFFVGALGSGFAALLFTAAIDYSHAGVANAISKTAPIFVAFLAYFTLREHVTWPRFLLILMMVAAAALIGAGELSRGLGSARQHLIGDALALGAGILRAAAEILGKGALRKFRPSTVAMWRFGIGFLITGVISLARSEYLALFQLDAAAWTLLLVLAGVSTSLSMVLYYRGLADIPAHVAVTLKLLGAIVTTIVCWFVLDEALNAYHISGIAVLVFGAYLIVMRTARQQAVEIREQVAEEAQTSRTKPWAASLKNKIVALVAGAIIVTVMSGTWLAIRHTNRVINDQVRAGMGETAYMLLQYQTLRPAPENVNYRQLVRKLVNHKMQGRIYSVEIVYALILDGSGRVIAHAADADIRALTAEGKHANPDYYLLGNQLLDLIANGGFKAEHDIIPLTAELEGYPQVLKMGCRKSIARHAASEITVRYFTLAVLLMILGILVTMYFVGHLTRPLERLSLAAGRIAAGELSVPLISQGKDEVHRLSDSMARIVTDLQTAEMLRAAILRGTIGDSCEYRAPAGPLPPVLLALQLTDHGKTAEQTEDNGGSLLNTFIAATGEHEGQLHDYGTGRIITGWGTAGPERDDVLRACLAGLDIVEIQRAAGDATRPPTAFLLLDYMPDAAVEEALAELTSVVGEATLSPPFFATAQAYAEVEEHINAKPIAGGHFYEVLGLPQDEAVRRIAESTDE